jgi:hypothetical protein
MIAPQICYQKFSCIRHVFHGMLRNPFARRWLSSLVTIALPRKYVGPVDAFIIYSVARRFNWPVSQYVNTILLTFFMLARYPNRQDSVVILVTIAIFNLAQIPFHDNGISVAIKCMWLKSKLLDTLISYLRGGIADEDIVEAVSTWGALHLALYAIDLIAKYGYFLFAYLKWTLWQPAFYGFLILYLHYGNTVWRKFQQGYLWLLREAVPYLTPVILFPYRTCYRFENYIIDWREHHNPPLRPYQYRNLPKDYIRLLLVLRRKPFTKIRCQIVHVPVASDIEYQAVSYRWNLKSPKKIVTVDNRRLEIQETIYSVLQYSQSFLDEKLLWIDSICINQNSEEEKKTQIPLMKEIYSGAVRVIAWLGFMHGSRRAWFMALELPAQHFRRGRSIESIRDEYCIVPHTSWQSLGELFSLDWWGRIWMLQEVAFAKEVHLVFGNVTTKWEEIAEAMPIITQPALMSALKGYDLEKPITTPFEGVLNGSMMDVHRSWVRNRFTGSADPLAQVLANTAGFHSTDPHDRIYALLGIAEKSQHQIAVDYSTPVGELYTETMRSLLRGKEPLYTLWMAGNGMPRKLKLPSWVPDWSYPSSFPKWSSSEEGQMQAGTARVAHVRVPVGNEPFIQVAGNLSDEIVALGPVGLDLVDFAGLSWWSTMFDTNNAARSVFSGLRKWLKETRAMAERFSSDPYPCQCSIDLERKSAALEDAFWTAIILGRTAAAPAPDGMFAAPEDYRNLTSILDPSGFVQSLLSSAHQMEESDYELSPWMPTLVSGHKFLYLLGCVKGRRIAVTKGRYLALVPQGTRVRDKVATFWGMNLSCILHERKERFCGGPSWEFVGASYVHGMMNGEGLSDVADIFTLF